MKRMLVLAVVVGLLAAPAAMATGGSVPRPRPPAPTWPKAWPAPLFQAIAGQLGLVTASEWVKR